MSGETFKREEAFHDAWARGTDLESILVREAFESFTALENRRCLELMGPLEDRKILDLGAGLGETSVYFALQGARVTAVDISPQMLRRASQLATFHGTSIETIASPLEHLDVAAGDYDFVYGANVLHHVTDIEATLLPACVANPLHPPRVLAACIAFLEARVALDIAAFAPSATPMTSTVTLGYQRRKVSHNGLKAASGRLHWHHTFSRFRAHAPMGLPSGSP